MTTESKLTKTEENLPEQTRTEREVTPPADIFENQDEILLMADMPGVRAEDLQVRVDKDVLILEGKKSMAEDEGLLRCELSPSEKISASLELGVLKVHLPKRESVKPRQIQVTAG